MSNKCIETNSSLQGSNKPTVIQQEHVMPSVDQLLKYTMPTITLCPQQMNFINTKSNFMLHLQ